MDVTLTAERRFKTLDELRGINTLDGINKKELSTNIDKGSSSASTTSKGCCRTGVGSGININFCPVINPTISPQINPTFNPTIQQEIKPIIFAVSSDGLRKMEYED
jgi:hypothetical protein